MPPAAASAERARRPRWALAIGVAALAACTASGPLQPFATDGCSLFPDRSLISQADWCTCCVAHDLAYWRGGTASERLAADQALAACVQQASGNAALAQVMYAGVRAGGGSHLYTPFRWGYGWPYGRPDRPLTADEAAQATTLERAYRDQHPVLACPAPPP